MYYVETLKEKCRFSGTNRVIVKYSSAARHIYEIRIYVELVQQ